MSLESASMSLTTANEEANVTLPPDLNPSLIAQDFYESFPQGKQYKTLEELRQDIYEYGKKYNIVMSIKNSNYRSIHLWCKHGGQYRKGKKKVVDEETGAEIESARLRQKRTQRQGCPCFIKARYLRGIWAIDTTFGQHNHVLPTNRNAYSIHRKQPKETTALIKRLLSDGQKIGDILSHLSTIGITNIIKKDIENMQQQLRRKKKKQAEASTIVSLPIVIQTPTATPAPEQSINIEPATLSADQIKSILEKQIHITEQKQLLHQKLQEQKQKPQEQHGKLEPEQEEPAQPIIIDLEQDEAVEDSTSEVTTKAVGLDIEQKLAPSE